MTTKKVNLTMSDVLFEKAKKKSKKLFYPNIQQYIYALIRRDVFRKPVGGRPKKTYG